MNTDLAVQEPQHGINQATFKEIQEQAITLANSGIVPRALRGKANDIVVIGMAANELGLGFVAALNKIHVIEGKPTLSAELMCALVQRAGHEIWLEESSATKAIVKGKRRGSEREQSVTFTIEEAKQAGVLNKDNWKKYPAAMLRARAISALCRFAFADVMQGHSYTPEELGAETDEEGNTIGSAAWWAPHVEEFGREIMQAVIDEVREGHDPKPLEKIDPPPTDVLAKILAAARKAKDAADGVVDAEVVEEPAESAVTGSANQGSEAEPIDGSSSANDGKAASDPETVQDSESPSIPVSPPGSAAQDEGEGPAGTAKAPVGSDPLVAAQQRALERAHKTPDDDDSPMPFRGCESGLHFEHGEQCPDCGWTPIENPCPHCGSPCLPWEGGNPKAPKWRCTNASCEGGENKDGDPAPWVSFHANPWREGGELDQMQAASESSEPEPEQTQLDGSPPPKPKKKTTRRKAGLT